MMHRQPTAARLLHDQLVEIYDQQGNPLYRAHVAPYRAIAAVVAGESLTVSLSDGRVQVFALRPGQNPVLRYTR